MKVKLFTDGGARGNPGPAAAAFVLEQDDGTVLDARGDAIGVQTNNVAEYTALVNGLRRAAELGVTEVEVVSDSELMVKQMRGEYKIKNEALRELSIEATRARPGRRRRARTRRCDASTTSSPISSSTTRSTQRTDRLAGCAGQGRLRPVTSIRSRLNGSGTAGCGESISRPRRCPSKMHSAIIRGATQSPIR